MFVSFIFFLVSAVTQLKWSECRKFCQAGPDWDPDTERGDLLPVVLLHVLKTISIVICEDYLFFLVTKVETESCGLPT